LATRARPSEGVLGEAFPVAWYERHPLAVAFDLLGQMLLVDRDGHRVAARIVEVEAYGGLEDAASHATMYVAGRRILATEPGHLYMQFAYGMHTMTNIVAHESGGLGAVLIRAADDPVSGLAIVQERRRRGSPLLSGPGTVSQGMGITMQDLGARLDGRSGISIVPGQLVAEVHASPRIGITKAADAEWRLFDPDSAAVSRHRRGRRVTAVDLPEIIGQLEPDHVSESPGTS
jgi:DNA-3-methyladenine glycosylase